MRLPNIISLDEKEYRGAPQNAVLKCVSHGFP